MISVIIPTFKRPDLLQYALASLAKQTFTDFEVIIVNDGGSTMSTVTEGWKDSLTINLIEYSEQKGPSFARNRGSEYASREYIAFLDDDDIFLPNHLQSAINILRNKNYDLVYSGAIVSDKRITELPYQWENMCLKRYPFDEKFLFIANFIHTGSIVTRNYQSSGVKFDESLSHCEDWDMWLSLHQKLGYRFGFINEMTTVYHQIEDTSGLVAIGQATVPSPFSVARSRLFKRWGTDDKKILNYREWMLLFDAYCNHRVERGLFIPMNAFDKALRYLYYHFKTKSDPDSKFLEECFSCN